MSNNDRAIIIQMPNGAKIAISLTREAASALFAALTNDEASKARLADHK